MTNDLKSAVRALITAPGNVPGLISISIIDRLGVPFFEEFAEDSREHERIRKEKGLNRISHTDELELH